MPSMMSQDVNAYLKVTKINKELLEAVWWTGVAISSCAITFRAYARWKVFRRYFFDDAFVLLAWVFFVAQMALCQVMLPTLNELNKIAREAATQGSLILPADTSSKLEFLEYTSMACSFGFTCTLWAIKASFLIFFRRLGRQVEWQNVFWYFALAITVIGFIMFLPVWSYKCAVGNMILGESKMPAFSIYSNDDAYSK